MGELSRIGIAIDSDLLKRFDRSIEKSGYTNRSEASRGLPLGSILVFPVLFAAGMSLIDTTDNILMLGAYGWAYIKPIRKLYYNVTITAVSVLVAFLVGGI